MSSKEVTKLKNPRIVPPRRAWVLLNTVILAVLIATGLWFVELSSSENQRLIDNQSETLTRARLGDLNRGDYRSFVEGIGRDFDNLYVAIVDGATTFKTGTRPSNGHCRSNSTGLVRDRELTSVEITMCRPFKSPFAVYITLALIYLIAAFSSERMLSFLEKASVEKLSRFFETAGVRTNAADGMVGILSRLEEILSALSLAQAKEVDLARSNALGQFAAQVAHDLRSPIMALNVALDDISLLPESKRMLAVNSVARVKDIAKSLMDKERALRLSQNSTESVETAFQTSVEPFSVTDIGALVSTIVHEKVSVLGSKSTLRIHWEPESGDEILRSRVQASELTRLVSNLINNAVESISGPGHVIVVLRSTPDLAVVEITDTGKGIPERFTGRVGTRGFTFGKNDGNGLGLYHAKSTIESWGGSFAIESIEGEGTMIAIGLLKS